MPELKTKTISQQSPPLGVTLSDHAWYGTGFDAIHAPLAMGYQMCLDDWLDLVRHYLADDPQFFNDGSNPDRDPEKDSALIEAHAAQNRRDRMLIVAAIQTLHHRLVSRIPSFKKAR